MASAFGRLLACFLALILMLPCCPGSSAAALLSEPETTATETMLPEDTHPEEVTSDNLLSSMTEQEYEDMVSKLRQELMQELTRQQEGEDHAEILEEQDSKSDTTE